jgi:transcriptional regulator with XRE-family HTH domain
MLIDSKSLSVTEFANLIGIKQSTLNPQVNGTRKVSMETIEAILNEFPEVSSDWLIRGNGSMLVTDALPHIKGTEGEDEMALHAEVAKLRGENEELHRALIKADGKVEYLENQVDKLNAMVYTKYQCVATTMDGRLVEPPDGRQGGAAPKCG